MVRRESGGRSRGQVGMAVAQVLSRRSGGNGRWGARGQAGIAVGQLIRRGSGGNSRGQVEQHWGRR